jgi:GDP-4-dehydro-6-deoxy-D-mannose reductase
MRVLITGVTGLIGSHLAEYLLTLDNIEVFGFKRWRSDVRNLQAILPRLSLLEGDVEDSYSLQRALESSLPDRVIHLAAQSYPSESWHAPAATFHANVLGTIHLLEGVRRVVPQAQVLIACSSAEYGVVRPEDVPIAEGHPLRPTSPYGVSKATQEMLGSQYHLSYGTKVYLARFFNQVAVRQSDRCSIQTFARQIAEAEQKGGSGVVRHGNLLPERDFLDARDGVRALWLLLERAQPGRPYNVCSGRPRQIGAILSELIGLSRVTMTSELDPSRVRPIDEPILYGDNTLLKQHTGWAPEFPFPQTLLEVLDYWRARSYESCETR